MPGQVAAPAATKPKPLVHDRLAKPRVARAEANRPATTAKLPARLANRPAAANAKPADTSGAEPAEARDTKQPGAPENMQTNAIDNAREPSSRAELGSDTVSLPKSIRDQIVAAATVAEQLTLAAIGLPQQMHESSTERASADAKASEPDAKALVALLISHLEIISVAELAGKDVAIDDRHFGSATSVKTALVAAGATEVQLSHGPSMAIDRLLRGEVPAAVVTLASPDVALAFPDIPGFHVFKIPLASR
jgi:hypothetical protein